MYITYCRNQKSVDLVDTTSYRLNVTGGKYRPTWLMRVSDWKRVPGKEAVDGYHTISYCWEQSGDVVKFETDDEYSLIDHGKHCIVEGYKVYEDDILRLVDFSDTEVDDQEDCENDDEDENPQDDKDKDKDNGNDNELDEEDDYKNDFGNESIDHSNTDEESDEEVGCENIFEDDSDANSDGEGDSERYYTARSDVNEDEKGNYESDDDSESDADAEEQESIDYNEYISWCETKSKTATIRYVTYDELLQQVCKDFQVEYVWYDKICIDQSDPKAKSREIKQMHKIYRNARYMIAMIPEVRLYNPQDFEEEAFGFAHKAQDYVTDDVWYSSWFKRSWTLEEVMMARRILIVGANTNMFQHSLHTTDVPTTVDIFSGKLLDFEGTERNKVSVNQALAFAHFRTSTKPHDMIYALKNTFSHVFDDIKVNYSTDIETVFNEFYRHTATADLSILCFVSNNNFDGSILTQSTMDSYNLPSWTGVAGVHVENRAIITIHPQLDYHIDDTMWMHITTKQYWKIAITSYDRGCFSLSKNSIEEINSYVEKRNRMRSAKNNDHEPDLSTADKDTVLLESVLNMQNATAANMTHYHQPQDDLLTHIRPLTLTEDCEECIVLPILIQLHTPVYKRTGEGVPGFIIKGYDHDYCLPVLRKCIEGTGQYRAIGIYYVGVRDHRSTEPPSKLMDYIGRNDVNFDDPKEIISALFENDCHEVSKEFIIE